MFYKLTDEDRDRVVRDGSGVAVGAVGRVDEHDVGLEAKAPPQLEHMHVSHHLVSLRLHIAKL